MHRGSFVVKKSLSSSFCDLDVHKKEGGGKILPRIVLQVEPSVTWNNKTIRHSPTNLPFSLHFYLVEEL